MQLVCAACTQKPDGVVRRESPREDASPLGDSGVVGTVMVRDVVSRGVVAHFRAHTAPLLVLQWDASGTLLVTASVHGHNVNVFQVSTCRCICVDSLTSVIYHIVFLRLQRCPWNDAA